LHYLDSQGFRWQKRAQC